MKPPSRPTSARTALVAAVVVLLAAGCSPAPPLHAPAPAADTLAVGPAAREVVRLADEVFEAYRQRNPEYMPFLGLAEVAPGRLTDNSPAALEEWRRREDGWAARLAAIDPAAVRGTRDEVTLGYLRQLIGSARDLRTCRTELWRVSEIEGWQATYAELAPLQAVGSDSLRALVLQRWRQLPHVIDTEIANLRRGVRAGYLAPRRNVEIVIEQLGPAADSAATASPFYSPAARDSSPEFRREWTALLDTGIQPAVRRYRDYLRREYLPVAREKIGVMWIPGGRDCYRAAVRAQTTVDEEPEELFARARRRVEEREAAIRGVASRLVGTGDPAALYRWLDTVPRNRLTSREQILEITTDAIRRAEAAAPRWFGRLPRAAVRIDPFPPHMERIGSRGRYVAGNADGSRPGTFLINLSSGSHGGRHGLAPLAFHEAYPGHHLQISIAQETPGLHPVAQLVNNAGFAEGWGKYAESLAAEMGLYATDVDSIGFLLDLPSVMVVDPGIHVMGWTREQAVEYLASKHPQVPRERLAAGVDRIAIWPAQAITYQLGADEIHAQRARAERALGPRFDIRKFHDLVLADGTITLPMLREKVQRWIDTGGAAPLPAPRGP